MTAVLALIALQAVVGQGSGRVSQAFTSLSGVINRVVDPTVPAIPDLRTTATPAPAATPPTSGSGDWPAALTTTRPTVAVLNA